MGIKAGEDTFYQAQRGIVQDGLVLNLDAGVDESYNGGTTWRDLKGGNNGTLTNGLTFNKTNGGNIVFDGTNEYVTVANLSANMFSDGATIFAFLKLDSAPINAELTGIWGFGTGLRSHYPWTNGQAYMNTFRTTRVESITLSSSVDITEPHSLCITSKNNDRWKMYQNTELVSDVTAQSSINLPCNLFGKSCTDARYFVGKFYSFLMYNRALTSDEVSRNYNATRHRFGV